VKAVAAALLLVSGEDDFARPTPAELGSVSGFKRRTRKLRSCLRDGTGSGEALAMNFDGEQR
jgi:hypothetical protein